MGKITLSEEQKNLILAMYKEGVGMGRLCIELRLPSGQVLKVIRQAGIMRSRREGQAIASVEQRWKFDKKEYKEETSIRRKDV